MVGVSSSLTGVAVGVRVGEFVDSVLALGVGSVSVAVGVSTPPCAICVARSSAVAVIDSARSVDVSSDTAAVDSSCVGPEPSAIAGVVLSGVGVISGAGVSVLFSVAISATAGAVADASD